MSWITRARMSPGATSTSISCSTSSEATRCSSYRRVLNPHGTLVVVGAQSTDHWIGAMSGWIKVAFIRPFVGQHYEVLMADVNRTPDLDALAALMTSGQVTPVIDRTYALADAAEAMRYLEQGHARGKVIVRID